MAETASKRVNDTGDSGMNSILALLNTIAGQDVTTKQTADVGPLRDIMSQISASEGTQGQALLESIFQQLAGRVPQAMGNTFNATGSRAAAGRTAGTLQKILADATISAQGQMAAQQAQRQQMLLQGAGNLANATRTTVQQQRSGASGLLQEAGKVLAIAKTVKDVTGFDAGKKAKDLYKYLTTEGSSAFTSAFPEVSSAGSMGMFGGTPGAPSLSGTTLTPGAGMSDMLTFFSSPQGATTAQSLGGLLGSSGGETFTLDPGVQTQESAPPVDYGSLAGISGDMFTLGDPATAMPMDQYLATYAPPPEAAVNMSNPETSSKDSILNFSQGGSNKAATVPQDSTLSDAMTVYNASTYVTNPNKRKDVFDFSDGDFADDTGDITDLGALYYPPLAAVRPVLNATSATMSSLDNFAHDPGKWFDELLSGDEPFTENAWQTVTGAVDTVVNFTENLGNIANETGDFFADVFGW